MPPFSANVRSLTQISVPALQINVPSLQISVLSGQFNVPPRQTSCPLNFKTHLKNCLLAARLHCSLFVLDHWANQTNEDFQKQPPDLLVSLETLFDK